MKRYRQLLLFGLISLVTVGSYIGYTFTIKNAAFSIHTVSGQTKNIDPFILSLQTEGKRSQIYEITSKGSVEGKSNSYFSQFFGTNNLPDIPERYYEFVTQQETITSGNQSFDYAIQIKNNQLVFKMYTYQTKEVFEKTFDYPSKLETGMDLQAKVIDKQAMKVYVQLDNINQSQDTKLIVLDLASDTVQDVVLQKPVPTDQVREFVAIHQNKVVYSEGTFDDDGSEEVKESYFLDDGNNVRAIKELDQQDVGYVTHENGRYLVGLHFKEEDTKQLEWSTFDMKTKQLSKHSVTSPLVLRSVDWVNMTNDMKLYLTSETENGFQVSVIDLKQGRLLYQGEIEDANHKKKTNIANFVIQ